VSHEWYQWGEGDIWLRGARGETRLVGMRQLNLSMGLVWVEVCILTQRATTSSKKFSLFTFYYHTHVTIVYCCKNACVIKQISSSLQVKNKPFDRVTNMHLFLAH
jgi:hypothetical protein